MNLAENLVKTKSPIANLAVRSMVAPSRPHPSLSILSNKGLGVVNSYDGSLVSVEASGTGNGKLGSEHLVRQVQVDVKDSDCNC